MGGAAQGGGGYEKVPPVAEGVSGSSAAPSPEIGVGTDEGIGEAGIDEASPTAGVTDLEGEGGRSSSESSGSDDDTVE